MGKHSNLGPIDPQIGGLPAHGIIDDFRRAQTEIASAQNQQEQFARMATWQPIIAKYNPALIGECDKAIRWSSEIVSDWLTTGMFNGEPDAADKAGRIVEELSSHELTKTHARHIHVDRLQELGVRVTPLEAEQKLQDAVLAVHHACVSTLQQTQAVKIIENQNAISFIIMVQPIALPMPQLPLVPPRGAADSPDQPSSSSQTNWITTFS